MSLSNFQRRAPRKDGLPVSLNHRLDYKLLSYAATASAAGVGVMAMAQPSAAEIVYTPTHQTITVNGGPIAIDLNNDGITDFTLTNTSRFSTGRFAGREGGAFPTGGGSRRPHALDVFPQPENRVVIGGRSYASALRAGRMVGPPDTWDETRAAMEICSSGSFFSDNGPWSNVKSRYLGLAFSVDGLTHFGWARLSVSHPKNSCQLTAVLTGYAYETIPRKPIEAGETSGTAKVSGEEGPTAALGVLALGSVGLLAWRRDEIGEASKN